MRALAASIALHVLVLLWLWPPHDEAAPQAPVSATVEPHVVDVPIDVVMLDEPAPPGGDRPGDAGGEHGGPPAAAARAARHTRALDGWERVTIHEERPGTEPGGGNSNSNGSSSGNGNGNGNGNGIGFGNGGGITVARDVPEPPPPKVSKARPPRLIWPNRDLDVLDESYFFVAKVTVDRDGTVAGARMVTTRPGVRGEHAANAIWTFRYAPALDDDGAPIRATIEQPFQVR